ncbi:MAG: phage holin family protein [Ramlibacter sp.]
MIHPIFSVLISKPELVMEHVSGYAALVREEASSAGLEVAKRAIAWGVTLVGCLLFLILAGVAAMLGALHGFHWTLLVVPGIALAMAVGGFLVARKRMPEKTFTELKAQIDADAQALRAIGARS